MEFIFETHVGNSNLHCLKKSLQGQDDLLSGSFIWLFRKDKLFLNSIHTNHVDRAWPRRNWTPFLYRFKKCVFKFLLCTWITLQELRNPYPQIVLKFFLLLTDTLFLHSCARRRHPFVLFLYLAHLLITQILSLTCLYIHMTSLTSLLPIDRCLSYMPIFTLINSAAMNVFVKKYK